VETIPHKQLLDRQCDSFEREVL